MTDSQATKRRHPAMIYVPAMLVALIGLADSVYLTVQHLTGQSVKCTVTNGCSAVLGSKYAMIAGIPTAAFGALAYFAAFSLATLALFGYQQARTGLAILVVPMFLMTCWLVYLQAFVLHAFCEFCLLSATMTLVLTVLVISAKFLLPATNASNR